MAAGRDTRRETLRIRREQRERNEQARKEREERMASAEAKAGITSLAERRRMRGKRQVSGSGVTIRHGHRVEVEEAFDLDEMEESQGLTPPEDEIPTEEELSEEVVEDEEEEDEDFDGDESDDEEEDESDDESEEEADEDEEEKMLDQKVENKMLDGEEEENKLTVSFASEQAQALAEEMELDDSNFSGLKASGKSGFTSKDVRTILENR